MNPKKYKQIADSVASEMGVEKQLVEEVVHFFYSKVRKSLSSLNHPRVVVPGLGTFTVRKQKLKNQINKYNKITNSLDPTEFQNYKGHKTAKERLEKLLAMEQILIQEEQNKIDFKQERDGKAD